jgi:hypothetical protein
VEDAFTPACDPAKYHSDPWHECYAKNEIMAMRAFWDMLDNNPDDLDLLNSSVAWTSMVDIWTLYEEGTANHQNHP